jgi:hypothetical protein
MKRKRSFLWLAGPGRKKTSLKSASHLRSRQGHKAATAQQRARWLAVGTETEHPSAATPPPQPLRPGDERRGEAGRAAGCRGRCPTSATCDRVSMCGWPSRPCYRFPPVPLGPSFLGPAIRLFAFHAILIGEPGLRRARSRVLYGVALYRCAAAPERSGRGVVISSSTSLGATCRRFLVGASGQAKACPDASPESAAPQDDRQERPPRFSQHGEE